MWLDPNPVNEYADFVDYAVRDVHGPSANNTAEGRSCDRVLGMSRVDEKVIVGGYGLSRRGSRVLSH